MKRPRKRQESEPAPAPDELRIVQDFVNTYQRSRRIETFSDPGALRAWLASRRLVDADASVDESDVQRAHAVRAALFRLIHGHTGAEVPDDAYQVLDEQASRLRLRLWLDRDGTRVEPAGRTGLDNALGWLLWLVHEAREAGRWSRLKVCAAADCRQVFYDGSTSRTGRWCSGSCGSRTRVRAYRRSPKYQRQQEKRKKWRTSTPPAKA